MVDEKHSITFKETTDITLEVFNYPVGYNNYQEATVRKILKSVQILCIKCHGKMIRVRDLYDDTLVGYSCQDCPHYNLLDNNPV